MGNEEKLREYLKRVTTDLAQTRERLRKIEDHQQEPVAIVGMGCRFPGGVYSPGQLWDLVAQGRDAIGEFPTDRGWDEDLYDPDPEAAGKSSARTGSFLYDAGDFDAGFFGISPREALAMDPQQRLLLETSWEALEDAGIDPAGLQGSPTGVFAGLIYHDYVTGRVIPQDLEGYLGTGGSGGVASGRVSYVLGLEGPAVTVDTACSSSLVALHLACQSLRSQECTLALAGGVTVMGTPGTFIDFSRQRGLAPDGRCKAYADAANGTGWGEGVGVLVVERLADARRNGHRVLAIVAGTAVNQDGASNGLTAPNGPSQQRVIRQALANAGLSPAEVDVIEGHGTGTTLGDPIEAQALIATYGRERPAGRPVLLGSVKSNIGHSQAAAGVAGIIKMVAAMAHGIVPATLHVDMPSSHVDWSSEAVQLVTEPVSWPETGRPRRAGVSSFGFSGTNAHVILEHVPADGGPSDADGDPSASGVGGGVLPVVPWVVSGRSAEGLRGQAGRLAGFVGGGAGLGLVDVGWSLAGSRGGLEFRAVVSGSCVEELVAGLGAVAAGEPAAGVVSGVAGGAGKVAFVFTGQGAQRAGMGRGLYAAFPVFAAAFDEVCSELDGRLGGSVAAVIGDGTAGPATDLDETVWAQAGLFAVEVALFRLLGSWGITPDVVAGHSIGEVAAAYVAGVWSLPDACAVVAARGRLMQALPRGGAMVAVAAGEGQVAAVLAGWPGAAVAAVNGPGAVVISGAAGAVEGAAGELAGAGVRVRRLRVSHAFHSPLMEPMLAEFGVVAGSVAFCEPRVPLVSGLTGRLVAGEVTDPGYWVRHVREAVRFGDAVGALRAAGARTFVEVGPDGVLSALGPAAGEPGAADGGDEGGEAWLPVLRRDRDEARSAVEAVAGVYVRGGAVDWAGFFAGAGARRVELPTYAFARRRYWLAGGGGVGDAVGLGLWGAGHPLLGSVVDLAGSGGLVLTGRLSLGGVPWLGDHVVGGRVLVPGTALAEMAVRAGDAAGCGRVEELVVEAPLVVPARGGVQVHVRVEGAGQGGRRAVAVYSRGEDGGPEGPWTRHAAGMLEPADGVAAGVDRGLVQWPPAGAVPVDLAGFYDGLARAGYEYGPVFRGVRAVWRRGAEIFAEVALPEGTPVTGFGIHPALLDAALHVIVAGAGDGQMLVPFAWGAVEVHAGGASAARVRVAPAGEGVSVTLADGSGLLVASVGSLVLRALPSGDLAGAGALEGLFGVEWVAREQEVQAGGGAGAVAGGLAVLGADGGLEVPGAVRYAGVAELAAAVAAGEPAPGLVVACALGGPAAVGVVGAGVVAVGVLELVQGWLGAGGLGGGRLVVVTCRGVDAGPGAVVDVAGSGVWGLVRVAASENPGRLVLADVDVVAGCGGLVVAGAGLGEPEFAVRGGELRVPRLVRAGGVLGVPAGGGWRLGVPERGVVENVRVVADGAGGGPLGAGQVRVGLRAAGVNFRDVLNVLGMYPGEAGLLGLEGAGVVLETGPGVCGLVAGDRVMGLFSGAFGPVAVTDARLLAPVPAGWSMAQAAAAPVVFLTAYYALVELAGLAAGETVLVHAAAGGVGMAAVQLARHLGARVLGTASAGKQAAVAGLGVAGQDLASSRDCGFEESFRAVTGGRGVDVVLDCLAGEFVDASLRLVVPGGRFIEMGKTDIRDPGVVAAEHRVAYQAFDLLEQEPGKIAGMLAVLGELFAAGALVPLPVTCWDVRRAAEAFRYVSQARHIGKVVLVIPVPPRAGAVLVTGGTGGLGGLVARHLAGAGTAELVLVSRRGPGAAGVAGLAAGLAAAGAGVSVVACDAGDRAELAAVVAGAGARVPLTGVVHAAGVLDDAVTGSLTAGRVGAVMRPKAAGAWYLHELTAGLDLEMFVLFSSVAGIWGTAGQGNYAAANTFLDGLAAHRRDLGLAGTSLAWGPWELAGGMAGQLSAGDWARMAREGFRPVTGAGGLALLDAARAAGQALLVAAPLDLAALRGQGAGLRPLLSGLVRPARGTAQALAISDSRTGLAARLATLPPAEQDPAVRQVVLTQAAAVLGLSGPAAADAGRSFRELGFDSLTAVELRNRLNAATGLRLPATAVFDYPTPGALAGFIRAGLLGEVTGAAAPAVPAAAAGQDRLVIVGMGCRFPGGVRGAGDLWELVAGGRDAIAEFPADRGWDEDLYDPDPEAAGKSSARTGGFLYDAGDFDAGFFGISPREALAMDPQQRLLLETSWEALEDAGIDPGTLHGSATGVFSGLIYHDYGQGGVIPQDSEGYLSTGGSGGVASGRVAYALGLEGPAVTVDTACSSSLVALHLACQSLRAQECTLALAGGVTVMATPGTFIEFSRQRGLAPDGRCKAYADAADGTAWGEGVGVLVVERLADARRNGHKILAVVAGSAVNQDGASNGLTAPNGPSQQRVIAAALASAGLDAGQVDAVEGHGTGTRLGDPIEAQALLATYGQGRSQDQPVLLGSVKSNIGHTQAAAGVAGIIKMITAMAHGIIPPTLHVDAPSTHVDWAPGTVQLVTQPTPWPARDHPRRAAVSSFGFSGTNAHIILEQAPAGDNAANETGGEAGGSERVLPATPWVVSGRTPESLRAQAGRLLEFAASRENLDLVDVGWSLAVTRSVFEHRAVITGDTRQELLAGLAALAAGQPAAGVIAGAIPATGPGRIGFVFAGQGSQRAGMGAELHAASPAFAAAFDEACALLEAELGVPVGDVVLGRSGSPDQPAGHDQPGGQVEADLAGRADQTLFAQSGLFAVEAGLVAMLAACGITPDAVAGHSVGEVAAAYAAGVLSLEDACTLVAARARLMQALPGGGAMTAIEATEGEVTAALADAPGVSIAAVNGPTSVVISGDGDAVAEIAESFRAQGRRVKPLRVSHAFHSHRVDPVLAELAEVAAGLDHAAPRVSWAGALSGELVAVPEAGYWVRQAREPVRFADAVAALAAQGVSVFVEIGPDGTLSALGPAALAGAGGEDEDQDAVFIPVLRPGQPGPAAVLSALARAHVHGTAVDWAAVLGAGRRVELPTYAFARRRYWLAGGGGVGDAVGLGLWGAGHPLLGSVVDLAGSGGLVLTGRLSLGGVPWLGDHVVGGRVLVPGTALAEMAVRAGDAAGCGRVEELVVEAPLVVPARGGVQVHVRVEGAGQGGRRAVAVYSRGEDGGPEGPWTRHAAGMLEPADGVAAGVDRGLVQWPPAGAVPVDLAGFYDGLARAGYEYGPVFRGVRAVWRRGAEIFAEVALPEGTPVTGFGIHPALLDAALHVIVAGAGDGQMLVPFAWGAVEVHAGGASAARVRVAPAGEGVSVTLADGSGLLVASVGSLVLRALPSGDLAGAGALEGLFGVEWVAREQEVQAGGGAGAVAGGLAVLGADGGLEVPGAVRYAGVAELAAAVAAGEPAPGLVVACALGGPAAVGVVGAGVVAVGVLELVQGWLGAGGLGGGRLVVVTCRGVDAGPGAVVDVAGSGVWGLVRVAASENPGRLVLADVDVVAGCGGLVVAGAGLGEPEFAVRGGELRVPRLVRAGGVLGVPAGGGWRLGVPERGVVENVRVVADGAGGGPLGAGQVRVGLRAAGVNFRDVLNVLGMYPGEAGLLGLEGAGVVLETGPGVCGLVAGDRVMGLFSGAFGPVAVTDARLLAPVPAGWSMAQAAAAPVVFLTAYYALVELAGLAAGETVLVHAAAGGVGMAAVQLARHLGARVLGTASAGKQAAVAGLGVAGQDLASSRDCGFEESFRAVTGGRGVDVVLDCLAGEFVDASLRLVVPGGRFIEMGKTDIRDPGVVAAEHRVAYQAFDLLEQEPGKIAGMLAVLGELFAAGALVPLPVTCWDVRRAAEAFRYVSQARHIGKVVLVIPVPPRAGAVLVTGGTGGLGGLVARHLAGAGTAELVLVSRRGPGAAGVAGLAAGLAAAGAGVSVVACDAGDRAELAAVVAGAGARVPLTGVVHAAGVLDDAVTGSLTAGRVGAVMRPKAAGAWYLHELTAGLDLEMFVLFSSVAGIWGTAGQGNYAAANTFLDGLAAHRRDLGLAGTSLAWGPWELAGGMAGQLSAGDWARMAREGFRPVTGAGGLALLDAARAAGQALLVAAPLDLAALRGQGAGLRPLLSGLVRPARGTAQALAISDSRTGLAARLATLPPAEQDPAVRQVVLTQAAAVLGLSGPAAADAGRSFRELGFDSLTAVELRNRLNAATGLRLPATAVFDYPTPGALAGFIRAGLLGEVTGAAAPAVPAAAAGQDRLVIVGMGCRFPGGVRGAGDLWELVAGGRDAIAEFPADRGWDEDLYDPDPEAAGKSSARTGGFLYDAGDFDAGFFGISPREALAMDPQQRLLLETSWEALEDAGIDPGTLHGSATGVFSGLIYHDYGQGGVIPQDSEGYLSTGGSGGVASGRVAYALGLEGPAVTVDTACSSSLVALHLACQSLRAQECTLALAGGVTVMATPGTFIEFSRQRGLAPDGRCKAYADAADGTAWGEGVGVLVVERLADARRNGHKILAVVAGSAVNQDGASNGLTAPNGPSQQRVIAAALASAGLDAGQVDAVEGHGTGTRLGDPIEAQALLATYGQGRSQDQPVLLGSVKSNIGHTQAAAGVAGIIKMITAMAHGIIPPTLHVDAPSTHVDWAPGTVQLVTQPTPWPARDHPRRAAVSSFGFSGTNAHIILEQAPAGDNAANETGGEAGGSERVLPATPWVVSGRTPESLRAQAGRLLEFAASRENLDLVDVGWSLAVTRSVFEHRAVITGDTRQELLAGLAALAAGQPAAGVIAGAIPATGPGRIGFVFAGQGSQRAGMGAELHAASPAFAAAFDEACALLEAELGVPVGDVVLGRSGSPDQPAGHDQPGGQVEADLAGRADQTLFAQSGLFAVEAGLVAMLAACGITPDAVAGHSVGEVAAAYAAGVLSLEDACTLVAARARLMQALPGGGAMTAIEATEGEVTAALADAPGVSIAAVNGPTSVVISGDGDAVAEIAESFRAQGRRVKPLRVSHAFHSHRVDPVLAELAEVAAGLDHAAPRVSWAGALSGELVAVPEAGYWVRQAREPVRFADAVAALAAQGVSVFVEIGPDGTLSALGPAALAGAGGEDEDQDAVFIPVLRPGQPGPAAVLSALARAHVHGTAVDWAAVLGAGRRVELPTYAFARRRYWPEPAAAAGYGTAAGTDGAGTAAEARFWAAVEGGDLQALSHTLAVDDRYQLGEVLPALASWRRREKDRSVTAAWRYRISWKPVTGSGPALPSGTWLVVIPAGPTGRDVAEQCARELVTRGVRVIMVEVAAGQTDREMLAARINQALAAGTQDPQTTPDQAGADYVASVTGVLSLLALDEAPAVGYPVLSAGLAGTQALVQALGGAGVGAPLWALTRGAVAAGAGEVLASAVQAQVWGLGRVAALEHPDRWGGLVDLPAELDDRAAARLCGVLAGCGEDQVAIRGAGIMARRLVRAPQPGDAGQDWVPGGTVLVTGGTGAIGGHLARWLAGRGAPRVVLASRSGPAAFGAAGLVAGLAAAGVGAEVIACDTAERAQGAGLLDRIALTGPPLVAVMHAAGLVQDTALADMTTAELAAVLAAKASGAAHLDELTADLDLEQFVLFSSIAATWGSGGQPGYAAANAFLDALAENRRGRGLAATSVAWGPWDGGGMTDEEGADQLQRRGLRLMDPQLAIRALGQVLDAGEALVTVADVDWTRFAPPFTVRRPSPLIEGLPEVRQILADAATGSGSAAPGAGTALGRELAGLPSAEQARLLVTLVRAEAAAVLGHHSAEAVQAGRAFKDLGFDSLTAVELRRRLSIATGLRLPATLVFDYPSPAAVAEFMRAEVLGTQAPAATAVVTAAPYGEPVAIVGMSCRLPGGVTDPEALWDLVASGTDAISEFPADRGWGAADPGDAAASYARRGGFVADAAEFDAGFFGISPREALAMDPQQRLLLETSWEALERAGIDPGSLRGSRTGVFAGAAHSGYGAGLEEEGTGADGYLLTGGLTAVISGRVSYALGLEGPAVTIDTACSSSLVALHLACQALRSGECTLALAGGVAVMVTPTAFAEFSRQQGLAADGRCKSFAATADGTGWAEGAGMLVVERLSDARRNGHHVLAVIRATAVNQDGASNGLTAPNGPSQQRVIRAALASAQLTADQVDAVEAHGTGTVLGDPIEAQALLATYGQGRPEGRPLWLGSVKSNIGHTQAAAGAAGVIKMVLAMQHGLLPLTLHAGERSPHVDWSAGDVRLLTEPVPWPASAQPRRAGISAFGISGTNAHAILEDVPAAEPAATPGQGGTPAGISQPAAPSAVPAVTPGLVSGAMSWLLSGRTPAGLAAQADRLAAHVTSRPGLDPADVAWSLAATRSVFEHRAVVTGTDRTELAAGLAAMVAGEPAAGVQTGTVPASGPGRVVFVFPGQGGQWPGMGRELAASSPVFAARLAECGQALAPHVDWDLAEVLAGTGGAPGLERADVVQPVLWAVMVSLAAAWQAAGITPDAVAGHSQGEIAAACVAGVLSLEDGARVVALRSRALTALAGNGNGNGEAAGGMLSVAEPAAAVRDRLAAWAGRLSVAAVNGPAATVVSGEVAALRELAAACADLGVRTRLLPVDYASHSIQVESIRPQILADLAGLTPGPARVPMISAMTGEFLAGPEADAEYWYASLRAPVDFDRAVRVLAAGGHQVFIEVSAHPVLTAAITATVEDAAAADQDTAGDLAPVVTGTLRRDDGGPDRFLASLAHVHVHGTTVNWPAMLGGGRRVELPTYAFQHQRFWARPARVAGDVTAAGLGAVSHPLLGAAVELAGGEGLLFTGLVSVQSQPWLADHAVSGTVLLPGTAFVELAVRAGDAAGCGRVQELALEAPLVLSADGAVQLQVVLGGPNQLGQRPVEVYARPADTGSQLPWTRHASGLLAPAGPDAGLAEPGDFTAWPPPGVTPLETEGLYEGLAAGGYGYGPAFRGLRAAWRRGREVFAEIALPEGAVTDAGAFGLHPALLDAALHAAGLAGVSGQPGEIMLPFAWTGVTLHAAGASVLRARLRLDDAGALSLTAADGTGMPVISVESVVSRPVPAGQLQTAADGVRDALFSVEWVQVPATPDGPAEDRWAVIGDDPFSLTAGLTAAGTQVRTYRDVAALSTAAEAGEPVPQVVLTCAGDGPAAEPAAADDGRGHSQAATVAASARAAAGRLLGLVQAWLTDDRLATTRLVVVTRSAVAAGPGEGVADLAGAAVRGLVRSAQSENPGRLVLADLPVAGSPGDEHTAGVLASVLASGEPELAIREGAAYGRRLARPSAALVPPAGDGPWRLDVTEPGTLDGLALVPCPQAAAPLRAGQVRIAVRAAGLNFRDVLISLDMYPGMAVMGGEIAGIVIGTGPGVAGLETGDRVLGLARGGFGPVVVTDARLVTQIPAGWSWVRAAAVPVAFTTAWYALADLATARPGQKLLVHAAAGGVGMAAVAIARHLGLEVYATASPGKHGVLAAMGLDAAHIASSRTADFEQQFLAATGEAGMDIVLNALAGELTDASLRLLPRGGTFIEMGKTDLRDAGQLARQHPGVSYRAFETGEAGSERLAQILDQVTGLLAGGQLAMPPVRAWDVRQAREAFRFMSQARHAGKIVLTIPPRPTARRAAGTVLVTGGTGLLGGLVARHLASTGRTRHVLLASRSGPAAPGAAGLVADLAMSGTGVQVAACDAGDRAALAGLLAAVPADSPLTTVVHAAGVIDDGVTGSLTPARIDAVMRPKADAAWHLHELTRGMDLDAFVLFSAAAATFGGAGQGNYAAANAFLDGLASYRRAAGLPAISLAWGLWATASAMTGHLGSSERARISRGGMIALTAETGLALLDAAVDRDEAQLVAARLDVTGLRARAAQGQDVPPLWRGLVGGVARPTAAAGADAGAADGLRRRLAGLPAADRDKLLLDLVRAHAAAVIGHASAEGVEPDRSFRELGFDSLTAVELRNRLNAATGLQLPATLVFDYPTPAVLCQYLLTQTSDQVAEHLPIMAELDKLESALSGIAEKGDEKSRVIMRLEALVHDLRTGTTDNVSTYHEIDEATDEQIFDLLDKELEG